MPATALLPLLIGDASGDVTGHPRNAFPKDTAEFRSEFGDAFANDLIDESNRARALRGLPPADIVYKGYGIFQYDLQQVTVDQTFFQQHLWYRIDACLERLGRELDRCFHAAGGDLHGAIRRYNGSGKDAETYADHVLAFAQWCDGSA